MVQTLCIYDRGRRGGKSEAAKKLHQYSWYELQKFLLIFSFFKKALIFRLLLDLLKQFLAESESESRSVVSNFLQPHGL